MQLFMIGLLFRTPLTILSIFAACIAFCSCVWCVRMLRCRLRDLRCCKALLRWLGHDRFDDFDLLLHVHSVHCEPKKEKLKSYVKATAGVHSVRTDAQSRKHFEQPLHILVEQGTEKILLELLEESSGQLLAKSEVAIERDILNADTHGTQIERKMVVKGKGFQSVKLKLTMAVTQDSDVEKGFVASNRYSNYGVSGDTKLLLDQRLRSAADKKASRSYVAADTSDMEQQPVSEVQKLKQACAGYLDYFEGLGSMRRTYCAVRGPPDTRLWILGVWNTKEDFDRRLQGYKEIDLRRITSVGGDPDRSNVFAVNFLDKNRDKQRITLRIVDTNREVWIEMLRRLLSVARDESKPKQPKSRQTHR